MSRSKEFDEKVISRLFDESDDSLAGQESVNSDPALESEILELQRTMDLVDQAELFEDPGEEFWDNVWPEFQNRLMAEETKIPEPAKKKWFDFNSDIWNMFWRPALQVGAVSILLLAGILIGKELNTVNEPLEKENQEVAQGGLKEISPDIPVAYDSEISRKKNEMLYQTTENSLQKSGRILNQFMEIQPEMMTEDFSQGNEFASREELYNLLDEINILRYSDSDPTITELMPLLNEIEIIVGEIAELEGQGKNTGYQIKILQNGIQQRKLLDRLRNLGSSRSFTIHINTK